MGNVLTNCPNNGVSLSKIRFNDPSGSCAPPTTTPKPPTTTPKPPTTTPKPPTTGKK